MIINKNTCGIEFGEEEGQVSLKDIEKREKERAPKKKTIE